VARERRGGVEPAQVRGEGDGPAPRIGVGDPVPDPVEDAARGLDQVAQDLLGGCLGLGLGGGEPDLEPLAGALGLALDRGPLEDHVARLEGGVRHRIGHEAAHAGQPLEGVLELAVVAQVDPAPGKARDAAEHRQEQPVVELARALGGEQAQYGTLQGVGVLEAGDAVVGERLAHEVEERRGDARAAGADAAHEHPEPRAVGDAELAGDGAPRRADEELVDVRHHLQLVAELGELPAQPLGEVPRQLGLEEAGELLGALRVGVVAEEHPAHLAADRLHRLAAAPGLGGVGGQQVRRPEVAVGPRPEQGLEGIGLLGEDQPRAPPRVRGGAAGRLDHEQHLARCHLLALARAHLADDARDRGVEADLHLHGLEEAEGPSHLDPVARRDVDGDHHRRRAGPHLAGHLPAEAVGAALDLDADAGLGRIVENAEGAAAELDAPGAERLLPERRGHDAAVEVHPVAPGADRVDVECVRLALVAEVDALALGRRHPRRRDRGGVGVEVEPRRVAGALIGDDRRGDQRGHGMLAGAPSGGARPIEPGRVHRAPAELRRLEHVDQEALVGGAALDQQLEVREGADEARARLLPRPARGDHLGDQRVEAAGDDGPEGDAAVHPHPGTESRVEAGDPAGCRQEARLRVLGADAGLDGDTLLAEGEPREALASGDADLEIHQVEAGDGLGDAVLDLETGVHLEEVIGVARHQVLDGADAAVADLGGEPPGVLLESGQERAGEARRRRLLDHLLVAALDRAVAAAEGVHVAVLVRHDLYLDVAAAAHRRLEEDARIAEGRLGLGARRAQRGGELLPPPGHADAAPPAAG
jgi:hypothetical protein